MHPNVVWAMQGGLISRFDISRIEWQELARNGRSIAMKLDDLVEVRRQWNSRRLAYVRREDITGVHWSRSSGGLNHRCPRPFLHGYVWCNAVVRGSLSHSCKHGPAPHLIKICITKKGNRSVFLQLAQAVPLTNERAEWSGTALERSILDQRGRR